MFETLAVTVLTEPGSKNSEYVVPVNDNAEVAPEALRSVREHPINSPDECTGA